MKSTIYGYYSSYINKNNIINNKKKKKKESCKSHNAQITSCVLSLHHKHNDRVFLRASTHLVGHNDTVFPIRIDTFELPTIERDRTVGVVQGLQIAIPNNDISKGAIGEYTVDDERFVLA